GDREQKAISYRGLFFPVNYNRTTSRTTPVHNIVDDVAWIKGSHTIKFGTNVRLVKNNRTGFSNAYDSASTNFFFYSPAGTAVTDSLDTYIGDPANNLLTTTDTPTTHQYIQIVSNQNGVDAAGAAVDRQVYILFHQVHVRTTRVAPSFGGAPEAVCRHK